MAKRGFMDVYERPGRQYDPAVEGHGDPAQWRRAFRQRMSIDEAKECLGDDDPLVVLGLTEPTTWQEIKSAYRRLAKKWHPDRNMEKAAEATEAMKRINASFTLLENLWGKA